MNNKIGYRIRSFIFFDTYGSLTISFFLIAIISGIFLAIPFDIQAPYASLGSLLISNPWGVFIRNAHYWSGQLFLIFALLHSWEYIHKDEQLIITRGKWLRLTFGLLVIFWLMLSGFILKADFDSVQARQILSTLVSSIPFIGKELSVSLLGKGNSYQLIYVHHIATTTLFLIIIVFEHAHTIWGQLKTFLIILLLITLFSFIFQAPLHNNLDPVIKGPWYFVGLQELLHWMSRPVLSLLILLILLTAVYFVYPSSTLIRRFLQKVLLYSFYFYVILTIIGYFFRGEDWQWIKPWDPGYKNLIHTPFKPQLIHSEFTSKNFEDHPIPEVLNRKESCLLCHEEMKGFSPAHNPQAIGCIICHGGNSFAMNKKQAHDGMLLIPGNLSDAERSCGTVNCHPDIPARVNTSIMSTMSGMINVDRFVFGEVPSLTMMSHVDELGQSPADNHFRDLCASCHIGNPKTEAGPVTELSRGGGCNACHLNYSDSALLALTNYLSVSAKEKEAHLPDIHPSLNIRTGNDHCFGCHSRSGRISTNYEGWHETLLDEQDVLALKGYRVLQDHRVFRSMPDDIHHEKGMDCIDCHFSFELMGEGKDYVHKEDQVKILCEDCHFNHSPRTIPYKALGQESLKLLDLRNDTIKDRNYLLTEKSGHALINTIVNNQNIASLTGKNSGKKYMLNKPADICTQGKEHDQLTCSACHTAWAPRCIGCHTAYEPGTPGIDLYSNKSTSGSWIEYAGEFLAGLPTLGIYTDTLHGIVRSRIKPAVPGMVLTIDKSNYPAGSNNEQQIFHRLFAPAEPHTIQKTGRSCISCHNSPVALGYGEGKLLFDPASGKWNFSPKYQSNKYDGLPEDAWIGFLVEPGENFSTRKNFRPFTLIEQQRILTVGTCLTCHDEKSDIMKKSLHDFPLLLNQISKSCKIPVWSKTR